MQQIHLQDLGLTDYKLALDYQEKLFDETIKIKQKTKTTV